MNCDVGEATEELENEFDVGEVTERLENEILQPFRRFTYVKLILQLFRCFTYITVHSPTLLSLLLRHRLFTYVTWRAAHELYLYKTRVEIKKKVPRKVFTGFELLTPAYVLLLKCKHL